MPQYSVSITGAQSTGRFVTDDHFAANALQWVNVDAHGHVGPTDGFQSASDTLGINHFRYPGGGTENVIDITRLQNGDIRDEVRNFLDWVVARSTDDNPGKVTIVLPTKTNLPAQQIEEFVYLLLEEYGDVVASLEIGNEYSIGRYDPNYDRSIHPEERAGTDFVSSMNEVDYGASANRVINAALDAMDRLAGTPGADPKILLQLADIAGNASTYKGHGDWDSANEAILEMLNGRAKAAVDGAIAHYYYNTPHLDSQDFKHTWTEYRSLDYRIDNFNQHLGRDVDLYVTEWNVLASNYNQLGAANASILLEMFEYMVQIGVQDAFVWPLQHRTGSNIAGNRQVDEIELSMGGAAFQWMADDLRPETSETGHVTAFESIATNSTGSNGVVEANLYSSVYQDVIFVSLRDLSASSVSLDIAPFLTDALSVDVTQLTIDRTSMDGLSDMADENGQNRIGRRYIDAEEYAQLRELPFFDPSNKNHIQDLGNGTYRTYLPTIESIIPQVANPRSIDDYYFATENDVAPLLVDVAGDHLGSGRVSLDMMPYDVAQIVIDRAYRQEGNGGDNDAFLGGVGADVMLGRWGDDTLRAGEANDTLKGGHGDDLMEGGSGDDYLVDGNGNDTMRGGTGDDLFVVTSGSNVVEGGAGSDVLRLRLDSGAVTVREEGGALRVTGEGLEVLASSVEYFEFSNGRMSTEAFLGEVMLGDGLSSTGATAMGEAPMPGAVSATGGADAFLFGAMGGADVQDVPDFLPDLAPDSWPDSWPDFWPEVHGPGFPVEVQDGPKLLPEVNVPVLLPLEPEAEVNLPPMDPPEIA